MTKRQAQRIAKTRNGRERGRGRHRPQQWCPQAEPGHQATACSPTLFSACPSTSRLSCCWCLLAPLLLLPTLIPAWAKRRANPAPSPAQPILPDLCPRRHESRLPQQPGDCCAAFKNSWDPTSVPDGWNKTPSHRPVLHLIFPRPNSPSLTATSSSRKGLAGVMFPQRLGITQQEGLMEARDLTDALLPSLASPPSRIGQLCPPAPAPMHYRARVTFKRSGSQASLRKFLRFTIS